MSSLGDILIECGCKLSVAESCTGGLLGSRITDVPGASRYFLGGVVAYSNEAKMSILGVSRETLERYGAVSEQCAREMAVGVAKLFGSEVSISTTGIAGPGGGTDEKPVGLVYIGIFHRGDVEVHRRIFSGSRVEIKEKIVKEAISLLLNALTK